MGFACLSLFFVGSHLTLRFLTSNISITKKRNYILHGSSYLRNDFKTCFPSQLGSFGGITRVMNTLTTRQDLLKIAAAGPLAGTFMALSLIVIGFLLPPNEGQGILVNGTAFHDSFLVGSLGKSLFLSQIGKK